MKPKAEPGVTSHLAAVRKRLGLSVVSLAAAAGVTRQTIYAIEAGTYVPNTAVGLQLARSLGVSLDDLFVLTPGPTSATPRSESVALLPTPEAFHTGQAVRLCRVDGNLVAAPASPASWYLPPSDGTLTHPPTPRGKNKVEVHDHNAVFNNRILLAGCDPAMNVLAGHLQSAGIDLVLLHQNSTQSLSLLKRGLVHVAGTHLPKGKPGDSNVAVISRLFPADSVAVISFAIGEEGIVAASGNPKKLRGLQDLTRKDITLINREPGSGSRALLDHHLTKLGIDHGSVRGYSRTAPGHLAAAWEVKTGAADCCLATQASASAFGLHFIPLESVRYDLAVRKKHLDSPAIKQLFSVMHHLSFRLKLRSAAQYNTEVTGSRVL